MSRLVKTQLSSVKGRVGHGNEKVGWVRNVGFATRAMLGEMQQDRGCTVKEVGRETRSLKRSESDAERKSPRTSRAASKAKVGVCGATVHTHTHTHTHTAHTPSEHTHTHTHTH